ncbi:glycosyl hydrolase [Pseudonocardia sp. RS010]|uniref:glycosyl hydrolase n=1 Tax=Pseudonocardia sp. RS010 TaxID=3385979 RepID=UPI0039A393E7
MRHRSALPVLVILLVLAGCTGGAPAPEEQSDRSDPALAAAVASLPQRSIGSAPAMRLAPGLVPPTNRWFSGLVFPAAPQPVFPLPLSVGVRDDGFAIALPEVDPTTTTIFGSHRPGLDLGLGTARMLVVRYDDLTVTVAFLDGSGAERGRVLLARGSPYVRYTATTEQRITLDPAMAAGGTVEVLGQRYGLVAGGGAEVAGAGGRLPAGSWVTLFAVPPGGDGALLAEHAAVAVLGGEVAHRIVGDRVVTTLDYRTDGGDTLVGAMPHQDAGPGCTSGTYPTIYGPLVLCAGTSLTVSDPRVEPSDTLDLSGMSDTERTAVAEAVREAAASPMFTASDTYAAGKQLARAANLLRLAGQLGLAGPAGRLRSALAAELRRWTQPDGCASRDTHCFVYDPVLRGVVGLGVAFGSEQFNDHQFHYGYFLYAAAVAARDDPGLAAAVAPVTDLLAADIGAGARTAEFPRARAFDEYAGHSWASGFSPFADGNNQESSSEAVAAYNGLALWAQVRGDPGERERAVVLLSREAAAAVRYYVAPPLQSAEFAGFGHRVVAINWGGKRDYATWFSPAPAAVLGIQLIPMAPVAGYLAGDADRIRADVVEAAASGFDVPFGDYLVMYLALADPAAARAAAAELPDSAIDGGNSRAYLLAWIFSRRLP